MAAVRSAENGKYGLISTARAFTICTHTLMVVPQPAMSTLRCFQGSFSLK